MSSDEFKPSSDRAIAFAKQMLARKKATEKQMVEDYKNNPEKQAAVAKLREKLAAEKNGIGTV